MSTNTLTPTSSSMRHVIFPGERRTEVRESAMPQPAAGELLVQVLRTALCGSDTKLWNRGANHVPGHEIFGCVQAPGHDLDGKRCLVYMPTHCGHCACCVRTKPPMPRWSMPKWDWTLLPPPSSAFLAVSWLSPCWLRSKSKIFKGFALWLPSR